MLSSVEDGLKYESRETGTEKGFDSQELGTEELSDEEDAWDRPKEDSERQYPSHEIPVESMENNESKPHTTYSCS